MHKQNKGEVPYGVSKTDGQVRIRYMKIRSILVEAAND
jgi:hypothetical protein